MNLQKVFLRRSKRIRAGHLWIFSNEIAGNLKSFDPGSLVEIYDKSGEYLGTGYINPSSLIAVRLLTRDKETIDSAFFNKRIRAAVKFRERFMPECDSFRAVFSEGDFLPGLIVDKYGDCLVVQLLTLGMDRMKDIVLSALDEVIPCSSIVLRNDGRGRLLEGLPLYMEIAKGPIEQMPIIHEAGIALEVNPLSGQKTGFFLDQRENRLAFCSLLETGKGLDLFCYSGDWGLHAAAKGCNVTFVDDSADALEIAGRNAALNNLSERCGYVKEDVFSFLRGQIGPGIKYDFVILDPPAFVKSGQKINEGLRGYRELNALAMSVIRKGGMLATSSCSYHIDKGIFADMLRNAARDAGRMIRLLEWRSQGKDHPVLMSVPETEYLKCAFLEIS
jgi:23S rRNA (cytosine1962-C5)-methyltransferase